MQLIDRIKSGRFHAAALVVLLLPVLASMTACAPTASVNDDATVAKNIDQWVMPLDEFTVYNPELGNYAEQLLIAKCLVAQGYEWPVPWQDTDFPQPEDFNVVGYRLFNMKIAQKWGYHFAPAGNQKAADAWSRFDDFANSYHPDSSFDSKLQACGDAVFDKKTARDADGFNYISGLSAQANTAALQESMIPDAIQRWKKCLSAKVTFALPDDPWSAMPPLSVGEEFGLMGDQRTGAASAEEISAAVADAKCRQSSGVDRALYDAEWDQQKMLVAKNRDKLDRIRRDALNHKKDLLRNVAENAPAAP